ncbi:SCO2322 family protein [Streptomyces sp. ICN903]|uniref:SCO2322 family protein n=1 Tax=Streptomyces sp. ICN903 TaxID=2964654 RepID=UPI0035AD9C18
MTTPRTVLTGVFTAVLAGVFTAVLSAVGAAPAHAAGYRYWSFWERNSGQWTYATQGPGTLRPEDGDVLGFRFAVSEDSAEADKPRGAGDFEEICGGTEAGEGSKRIALSVDFGTRADAPGGEKPPRGRTECAHVPEDGTAAEALAAVLKPLRYNSDSLLCAIAGYPRTGCGEQVSDSAARTDGASGDSEGSEGSEGSAAPEDTAPGDGGGPSAGLVGGGAVVAVLAAAAVWQARRRRS